MTLDFVWLKRTLYDISDVITSHTVYISILCSYLICIIQIFIPFFQVLAVLSEWCQAPISAGLPGHKRVILSWKTTTPLVAYPKTSLQRAENCHQKMLYLVLLKMDETSKRHTLCFATYYTDYTVFSCIFYWDCWMNNADWFTKLLLLAGCSFSCGFQLFSTHFVQHRLWGS